MSTSDQYAKIIVDMAMQWGSFLIIALCVAAIVELLLKLFIKKTSDTISKSKNKNLILFLMVLGMIGAVLWLINYYSSLWGFT
ncbi:MAG: hypothetical protein HFG72_11490 [Hungatella sp.]|nr:hypothetical protein [Hungatella sp.]